MKKAVLVGMAGALGTALMGSVAVRKMDGRRADGPYLLPPDEYSGEQVEVRSGDGTRLSFQLAGDGDRAVFFVHGWMCNGNIFQHQQRSFSDVFKVVTLDLRGHGRSAVPQGLDYHANRLAEDLKAAVDFVDPASFVVAGHSMGGFTAFKFYERFASEYEGRLKGLAIVDSTGTDLAQGLVMGRLVDRTYPFPLQVLLNGLGRRNRLAERIKGYIKNSSIAYLLVRWAAFGARPCGSQVEFVRQMVFDTPVVTASLAARGCLDFHYEYFLGEVRVPVIVMVGEKDKLTNLAVNSRTACAMSRCSMKTFSGAGHCVQLERTEDFNRELKLFFEEVLHD